MRQAIPNRRMLILSPRGVRVLRVLDAPAVSSDATDTHPMHIKTQQSACGMSRCQSYVIHVIFVGDSQTYC
jgi:hypothetical protein